MRNFNNCFTIVFIISQLLQQILSGQIYGTDIQVMYPVAFQATQYSFNIMFETILTAGNYLRISMPYQIDYLNGVNDVKIVIQDALKANPAMSTNTVTVQDSIYHFSFPSDILPFTWYSVTLTGVVNLDNPQTVGFQNLIQVATVTSTVSSAVVIDSNFLFGFFALSSTPPSTATIQATALPGQNNLINVPGQSYQITLVLATTQNVSSYDQSNPSGVQYQVAMTDISFSFMNPSSCTILNRPTGICSCSSYQSNPAILLISCSQDLLVANTQPIQVQVTVQNSMKQVQNNQGFNLSVIYPPTQQVVETGSNSSFFSISYIQLSNLQLKLMHGIPYTTSFLQNYQVPLGIYIPSTSSPRFQPFNSVRVVFQVTSAISNPNGGLVIQLTYNSAESILESSIYHNLPQINPNTPIKCQFNYQLKMVSCVQVGQLLSNTNYFVGCRIALTNNPTLITDSNNNLAIQNFGGVQILSALKDSNGNAYFGPVSQITYPVNSINVYKNVEFIDSTGTHSLVNFGDNIVVSSSSALTLSQAFAASITNGANIGIFPSSSNQRLLFYIGVTQMQQTFQDFLGYRQQSTMKLIYNDNVIQISAADQLKGIEVQSTQTSYFTAYNTAATQLNPANMITQQQDSQNNKLFSYAQLQINSQRPIFAANNQGFSLQNVQFPSTFRTSQFLADDRVLDFLLTFMYQQSSTQTNLLSNSQMLFHGYTISSSYVDSSNPYEASFSNVYSKGADYNKGYKIPTLLRLYGQLTTTQIGVATVTGLKIAIIPDRAVQKFFTVNQFYVTPGQSPNEGCGGTTQFCYSYEDGGSQKISSPPDNWSLNPFVVLDLSSVTINLSQAIALALKSQKQPKTINIAVFQFQPNGLIEVVNTFRLFGASLGLSNFLTNQRFYNQVVGTITSANSWDQTSNYSENSGQMSSLYQISSLSSIGPSKTATSFLILSQHTDSGNLVNRNNQASLLYGSGFTICSFQNDLIGTSQITAFPGSSSVSKCIQKFRYKTYLMDIPYYNYITFCPFDSSSYTDGATGLGVTFQSFNFPNQWGVGYPLQNKFAYSWSNNNGQIIAMMQETQKVPATGYVSGCLSTAWSPQYQKQTDRQQISMNITPSVQATLNLITDFYNIILTFDGLPSGMIFFQQCFVQTVSNPSSNISPQYTNCAAKIKTSTVIQFTITKINDDGIPISFNPSQQFSINFVISFLGTTSNLQKFTVQLALNSYIQDLCNSGTQTSLPAAAAPSSPGTSSASITISNFQCTTPTILSNTMCQWNFAYSGISSIPNTTIRFYLGFLSTPKMISNLDCQIFEQKTYHNYFPEGVDSGQVTGYQPSDKFSQISYNLVQNTMDIVFRGYYTPPTSPFLMKCFGFKTPTGDNNSNLSVQWIDTTQSQNTVIQSSFPNINYYSFTFFRAKQMTSSQLKLISKIFSAPGFEAVYTIQFVPQNVKIVKNSRIYIEFSVGYKQNLNSKGSSPQCQLNGYKVACILDQTNVRRLVVYPLYGTQTSLPPLQIYTLVIAGVQQPQQLDSYGYIWFGIDADDNLANGINEQGDLQDNQVQQAKISYLSYPSFSYSTLKIRQPRVLLSLNFTCSASTITSNRIAIIRLNPAFFNSQLDQQEVDFQCNFFRSGDPLRINITSTCERIFGNSLIRMNLTGDSFNNNQAASYWIQVFYLPSPDYSNTAINPIFLNFFITDSTMNTILYAIAPSLTQTSTPISFSTPSATSKQIMFYSYFSNLINPSVNAIQTVYNQLSGREKQLSITIYRGVITNNIIYLSFLQQNTQFDIDYSFYYVNSTVFGLFDIYMGKQSLSSSSVKINTGDNGIQIALAASETTPLNTYTLQIKKVGLFEPFEDPEISYLPNLVVNVQEYYCQISLSSTTLSIPVGSISGPIILDFSQCLPSKPMTVNAKITSVPSSDITFYSQANQVVGYLYQTQAVFYFSSNKSLQPPYNTYTVTFTFSGVNYHHFILSQNTLTITVTAPPAFQNTAITGFSQALSTDQSQIKITGQCNQSGYLYWVVGINESYLNSALFTVGVTLNQIMQQTLYYNPSTTVSLKNVLNDMRYKQFYWVGTPLSFSNQLLARNYGVMPVVSGSQFTLTLNDLPQRSIYSFTSYCYSNLGVASTAQNATWTTSWRLDSTGNPVNSYNHVQIDLTFNTQLSNDQINNLQCQLQQALSLNVYSLSTSTCAVCNQTQNYTIVNPASKQDLNFDPSTCVQKTKSTNAVVYTFYAWSGEQSTGIIIDVSKKLQALLASTPCFFVLALNYSYDLDIVQYFTNIYIITPITPQASTNLKPQIDLLNITYTNQNITLQLQNKNVPGFLIIGAHKFQSQQKVSSSDTSSQQLTRIALQPTPLKLRQGLFGDNTVMNLYHNTFVLTANQYYNFTINLTLNYEYAIYWTVASYDSCADSQYAPIGYKQFIFKGNQANSMILSLTSISLIIFMMLV
ncbi:hypothetical protein TTHERM_00670760 (macronuclear) [Tetrahymena thermophila SB210]|uniref:Transmembrane protein n=1 Tax=Tetrahymena thermophila (strain SB210) TaxID=312017 RepID=I7LXT4_TETTS|nr:hypothetical protein TTHERM_00670760 [Tetrahymena thermophila SB210]EAS06152.2 hypothetical protein TTHERM_00670760 [Tetrahymena thermophila SB210]|eukprot:XP_001026397.2 hypothetical protein TTHERM_00670760 [Tetrahymena thermophila SB210]